ncbi:MAG: LysR substrate-binding domain-containing protein [Pseudomonadota bacterium]
MEKLKGFSGRLLSAFLTLADTGQFTLAAERFNVSLSAFSQMISRLEAQLGTRLFDRNPRQVSLTPEGQLLVPLARSLAIGIEDMYATLRDHAERRKGKVAVAALPSLCADWLPSIVAGFKRKYPGIQVQLFDTVTDLNLELVRKGVVDFAINARVGNPDEFDVELLFNERFFLICPPDHPFADKPAILLRSLAGSRYIHTSLSGSVWHWISMHTQDARFEDTGLEVGHLSTLAGLIANGLGVSIVPQFALSQFLPLGLKAVAIRDKTLQRPLLLVRRRGHGLSVAAQTLLDLIKASQPEHISTRQSLLPGSRQRKGL